MHLAFNTRALLKQSRSLSNFLAQAVRGCSEDYKITNCCNGTSPPYSRNESEVALFFFRIEEFRAQELKDHGTMGLKKSFFNHFWLSRRKGVYVSCSWPFSDSSVSILWTWHQTPNGPRTFCRPKKLLKSTPGAKKHEHVSPLGAIAAMAWKMTSPADQKQYQQVANLKPWKAVRQGGKNTHLICSTFSNSKQFAIASPTERTLSLLNRAINRASPESNQSQRNNAIAPNYAGIWHESVHSISSGLQPGLHSHPPHLLHNGVEKSAASAGRWHRPLAGPDHIPSPPSTDVSWEQHSPLVQHQHWR